MKPETLARLHAAAFADQRPWSAAEFAALLASPHVFVVGDATGFALGRVVADEAELLTLATHPAHRRQGRGTEHLTAFHRQAQARGARSAFLEVAEDNIGARAMYERAGYHTTATRKAYYQRPDGPAVAALIMICPLAKS